MDSFMDVRGDNMKNTEFDLLYKELHRIAETVRVFIYFALKSGNKYKQ